MTLQKQQQLYQEEGLVPAVTIIKPEDRAAILRWLDAQVAAGRATRRDKTVGGTGLSGEFKDPRHYRDTVLGGVVLGENDRLRWLYAAFADMASEIAARPVVLSPFEQSAMTMKLYDGPGCEHSWHVESNSLTGLLYLTDITHDGRLEYCRPGPKADPVLHYVPKAGEIVLLRGHDVWHRVPPMTESSKRVCIVFNYYHPDDVHRPAGLDGLLYADKPNT